MINITLPYPPTVNTYWRFTNTGVYISAKGKHYKNDVKIRCMNSGFKSFSKDKRLKMFIVAHMSDKRRRDIDNVLKALLDALSGMIYDDDSQVDDLQIVRGGLCPEGVGSVEINVSEMK